MTPAWASSGRLLDVTDLEMPVVVTVHPSAVSGRVRRGPSGAWSSYTISHSRGQPPGRTCRGGARWVVEGHTRKRVRKEHDLDSDRVEGKTKQVEGEAQEAWGKVKDKARDVRDDVEDALDRAKDKDEDNADVAAR